MEGMSATSRYIHPRSFIGEESWWRRFLEDRSFDYRSVNCFERKNEGFVFHATLVDALREMRPLKLLENCGRKLENESRCKVDGEI